jgi:peptidoglycan-N-acetylglucosamine deacetylase
MARQSNPPAPGAGYGTAAGTGSDPSWAWEDARWRAVVQKVRAGRSLKPERWKDGARVAVALSFDSDHETWVLRDGGSSPAGLAMGQYGARAAVPRVLRLLERYGIPATFFVPAVIARLYPDEQRRVVEAGHEIGIHGWIHERNSNLAPEVERDLTLRSAETLEQICGVRPVGMRTPSWDFSLHTLQIIRELGLLYDSSLMADDEPYELLEDGQPTGVVELPPEWIRDDFPYFNFDRNSGLRPHTPPEAVRGIWQAEFDGALAEGGLFLLTMHPQVIGHRSRVSMLEALIRYMRSFNGVWRPARLLRGLPAADEQLPQPGIAQHQPAPQQRRHVAREQHVGEQRMAHAELGGHRAAQVPREQHDPIERRARDHVERRAHQQDRADDRQGVRPVAQLRRSVHRGLQHEHLHDGVHQAEEHRDGAEDCARPELRSRYRFHEGALHAHSLRLVHAVEHPVDPVGIHQGAELRAPEGVLDAHHDAAGFGQGLEFPRHVVRILEVHADVHVAVLGGLHAGRRVAHHHGFRAQAHQRVYHALLVLRGARVTGRRNLAEAHQAFRLGAQRPLVQPDGLLRVAAEDEIGSDALD